MVYEKQRDQKPNIVFLDIEVSANLSYVWGFYEQNTIKVEKEWDILSFSAKVGRKFITLSQGDCDEEHLMIQLWNILNDADCVIAHNGKKFDIRKINTRFIKYGLTPPSPYKVIDTLQIARQKFAFNSNRLDALGEYLGIGRKKETGGFELWERCMKGDQEAYKILKKYNEQDVRLLERVYQKLLPWIDNHPNYGVYSHSDMVCPNCGSQHLQSRGTARTTTREYRRYQCQSCGKWSRDQLNINTIKPLV